MVSLMSASSVKGDHTGLGQGGFFCHSKKMSPHGLRGSLTWCSTGGTHRAKGGGPLSSAAEACRCMSMMGSGFCADAGTATRSINTAVLILILAPYSSLPALPISTDRFWYRD
jgi:hypothetical protein